MKRKPKMKLHEAVSALSKMLRSNVCASENEREALELAICALKRWRNGDSGHDR